MNTNCEKKKKKNNASRYLEAQCFEAPMVTQILADGTPKVHGRSEEVKYQES